MAIIMAIQQMALQQNMSRPSFVTSITMQLLPLADLTLWKTQVSKILQKGYQCFIIIIPGGNF